MENLTEGSILLKVNLIKNQPEELLVLVALLGRCFLPRGALCDTSETSGCCQGQHILECVQ